jgi:hypothetical protein
VKHYEEREGAFISEISSPNDRREGWVDYELGRVVNNVAHPFAKNLDVRSGIAVYQWTQKKGFKGIL